MQDPFDDVQLAAAAAAAGMCWLLAHITLLLMCRYWDTRPTAVITRITQLMGIAGSFISGLINDLIQGEVAVFSCLGFCMEP